jgi:hypothetical protein
MILQSRFFVNFPKVIFGQLSGNEKLLACETEVKFNQGKVE